MDEEQIIELDDVEIRFETPSSDEEIDFQFEVDDEAYSEVMRDLKATNDSDMEESEIKIDCPIEGCKRSFSRKHNLVKHIKSHDLEIDKPGSICHICGKLIRGVYSLHLKIHENMKQFSCDDCGRQFRQKVALNNHLLIHRNERPHECMYCYKRFRQKYTMQHHIKNRHVGVKDHICDLCGKEFGDRGTLQKHSLVHSTNKPHQCATCFMSFRHKSSLSRHNKIHLKVTQCTHCDRSFRYESFLKKHLQTAHKDMQQHYEMIEQVVAKGEIKREEEFIDIIYENQTAQVIQIDDAGHHYYATPLVISNVQSFSS